EPDRSLRAASKALEEAIKDGRAAGDRKDISKLWGVVARVVETIDEATNPAPHDELLHSSWGAVGEAVELIAASKSYSPAQGGHPDLDRLLRLNSRLSQSRYPEPRETGEESGLMAWGNWDVRVHAASAAMHLAQRFADTRPEILEQLAAFAADPVRAVRLQ